MPFELDYGSRVPIGFAAGPAAKGSATAQVVLAGLYTSEDGDALVTCLDGFSSVFLDMVPPDKRPRESQIDHLVAIVRKNGKATLYINELAAIGKVMSKRDVNKGEGVRKDDIADIHEYRFDGIDFPSDAAVVVIVSAGWRKGLYFDYTPLHPETPHVRTVDIPKLLGELYTYLVFQERLKISPDQWEELFRQRWFPFIGLSTDELRSILAHASLKAPIDSLLEDMAASARAHCARLKEVASTHPNLQEHRVTIVRALTHFESGHYLDCATMLFPRIEGVLRRLQAKHNPGRATQSNLAASAVFDPDDARHNHSLLLPRRFQQFLEMVFFADFDPGNATDVSRNTVSHGVAPEHKLDYKSALMAVLTLDQIVRLMPTAQKADSKPE